MRFNAIRSLIETIRAGVTSFVLYTANPHFRSYAHDAIELASYVHYVHFKAEDMEIIKTCYRMGETPLRCAGEIWSSRL